MKKLNLSKQIDTEVMEKLWIEVLDENYCQAGYGGNRPCDSGAWCDRCNGSDAQRKHEQKMAAYQRKLELQADEKVKRLLWESCLGATIGCHLKNEKLPCERGDWSCLVYGEKPCNADFVQDMYQDMLDNR